MNWNELCNQTLKAGLADSRLTNRDTFVNSLDFQLMFQIHKRHEELPLITFKEVLKLSLSGYVALINININNNPKGLHCF